MLNVVKSKIERVNIYIILTQIRRRCQNKVRERQNMQHLSQTDMETLFLIFLSIKMKYYSLW